MSVKNFLDKNIIVKQVRSSSKLDKKQLGCIVGLGLRGIGSSSKLKCDQSIAGMIKKVEHIVTVELA